MSESEARIRLGREPIPGDRPAGQQVADEPDFEALKSEATKDPIHGAIDWPRVVELGTRLLSTKGKDFVAATYLVVGLAREGGLAGLADGLALLEGMVQDFWDQGFPPVPKRMRARANALAWMGERAAAWLEGIDVGAADAEALARASQALSDLSKRLEERMGEAPAFGDLLRGLRTAQDRLPATPQAAAPALPSAAPASAPAAGTPAGAARPATAPAATSPAAAELVSKSDAVQWIYRIAGFFREREPSNPISFRLARTARWAEIVAAPPAQNGQTQLLPPPTERIAGLRSRAEAGDWPGLLEGAEESFRERPLWLDAQRYADRALEGLGGPYRAAREAVALELRALLARVPELPSLAFKDGSPLADADTREWIQQAVLADGGAAVATAAPVAADDPAVDEVRQQARELLRKKRVGEALRVLDAALSAERSPRRRFLARLEIASLCAEAGHDRLAAPLLEELDEAIERHGLDRWEPDLCVGVLSALYRCRRKLATQKGAPPEAQARAEETFARLCRIDPVAAAALE
jgi:type VI secretion system protein VasJ